MNGNSSISRRIVSAAIVFAVIGQACTISLFSPPTLTPATPGAGSVIPSSTPYPATQTTFVVTLPEPLLPNETLICNMHTIAYSSS